MSSGPSWPRAPLLSTQDCIIFVSIPTRSREPCKEGLTVPGHPSIMPGHWSLTMPDLPTGTVTFLFTDIEGSTALWERDRTAMASAVVRHLMLLGAAIAAHDGVHFKTVGDAVQAAFPTAP